MDQGGGTKATRVAGGGGNADRAAAAPGDLWCVVRRSYKLGLFIYGWKKSSFFFETKIIYTKKGNSLQIYWIMGTSG